LPTFDAPIVLCLLLGGFVHADTEAAWQVMISQPLVACTLAGWLLGNLYIGMTVGILMQLPFLVELPVGGTKLPLGNVGALVGTMLAIGLIELNPTATNTSLTLGLIFGVVVSWAGTLLQGTNRDLNLKLVELADKSAANGNYEKIVWLNYSGAAVAVLFGIVMVAGFYFLLMPLADFIVGKLVNKWENIFRFTKLVFMGAGFGAVTKAFLNRKTLVTNFAGAVAAAILIIFF